MHQASDIITITLKATAAQWQDFLAYLDMGAHRVVRPFIDPIMQQAQEQDREPQTEPPAGSRVLREVAE